jgi:hypothetical protein
MVRPFNPGGLFSEGVDPIRLQAMLRQQRDKLRPQAQAPRMLSAPTQVIREKNPLNSIGPGLQGLGKGLGKMFQNRKNASIQSAVSDAARVAAGPNIPAFKDPGELLERGPGGGYAPVTTPVPSNQIGYLNNADFRQTGNTNPRYMVGGTGGEFNPGKTLVPEKTGRQAAMEMLARNPDTAMPAFKQLMTPPKVLGDSAGGYFQVDPLTGTTTEVRKGLGKPTTKPSAQMQAYNLHVEQAREGGVKPLSIDAWLAKHKKSGVTVNMGDKFDQAAIAPLNKLVDKIHADAMSVSSATPNLETMRALLDTGLKTGGFQNLSAKSQGVWQDVFGGETVGKRSTQEAFTALSTKLVMPMLKQMGRNPTDKDLEYVETGYPTLEKTREGNYFLIRVAELQIARVNALQGFTSQWVRDNISMLRDNPGIAKFELQDAMTQFIRGNDLWTGQPARMQSEFQRLTGEAPTGMVDPSK